MKHLYLFIPIYLCSSLSFAQPFEIALGTTSYYSIDYFENDIYYYFIPENRIYKTNIKKIVSTATNYPTIPSFANKSHIAVYPHQNNLYLQDFEQDTTYLLLSLSQGSTIWTYEFSPNDSNIIVFDRYYSFKDSQSHPLSFQFLGWDVDCNEWSSDSTIISYDATDVILQYYLYSNRVDTFFFLGSNIDFSSFSYNASNNASVYSTFNIIESPKLYLHNFETNNDSILFDPSVDDSSQIAPCWSNPISIKSINFSPNERRIAFFNTLAINPGSGLYIFESDSGYAKMYLDCFNYGVKYSLEWLRNDTLIYYDATNLKIYGIDVRPITDDVPQDNQDGFVTSFSLEQNYPNPFNPLTKIKYQIPQLNNVSIKIYDILGKVVANLVNEEKPSGEYEVEFDGRDLPSGIYFYQLKTGSYIQTKKMVLLK